MARRIQLRRDTETNWSSTNPVLAQGEIGIDLTNNKIKIGNGSTAWNSLAYFDDKVTDFSAVATNIVPDADNTRDLGAPDKQWRHVYTAGGSIYLDNIKLSNVDGKFVATKVINPGEENEAEDPEDSDATSNISGGGNPFDQDLNTYDSVTFDGVGATTITVSQINGTNPGDELVIQANNNNWTFGTDGNLTLPAGGDIVDSNGDSVLGGGNANTGDVTFDGVKIIGAGEASGDGSGYSTLELVPDNSLYNNHQYLVIDPTDPNHIHIRAGGTQDNSDAELFLGGEKNYLRVRDNSGSVRMQTQTLQETGFFTFNTTLGFVSATWQSDGNGGYCVFMIEVTPELYNAISNSNSDSNIQLYDGTNYYTVTSTGMTPAVGAVVFGVVQAPDGGGPINIVEINITNFTLRTNYAELNGPDFTVNVYDDVRLTGSDVVSIRNRSVNDPVTIVTDYDDSERTWSFGSNGDLSLPQDGGLVFDRNNTSIRVGMGFHIASGEGISLDAIDQTDPNNLVYKSWGFAPTGILTLPNGSSIESTAGNGIGLTTDRGTILFGNSPEIGGPSHFHIMKPESTTGVDLYFGDDYNFVLQRGTAYGDDPAYGVEIGANDRNEGGQKRWRFGTDGTTSFPSNKIKTSADNSLVIETESLPPEPPTTIVISGADFSPVNTTYNKDGANSIWYPALYNPATDPYIEFTGGQYGIFVPGFGQALYVNTGTLNVPLTQWNTNPPLGSVPPTGVYTYPGTYVHNWTFGADGYLQFPNLSRLSAPQGSSTATFQAMNEFAIQTAKFGPTWTFGTDGTLTVPGHVIPSANLTYDLGSTSSQWRSLYVGTSTVYFGGISLTVSADGIIKVNGTNLTENIRFSNDTIENSNPNGVTLIKAGTVKVVTGNESTATGFTMTVTPEVFGNLQGNEIRVGVGEFPVGSVQPGWEITFKSGTTASYTATVTGIQYDDFWPTWQIFFDGPPVDYTDYNPIEGTGGGYPLSFSGPSSPISSNTWTFSTDGSLTFPDGTTSTGAIVSVAQGSSFIIQTLGSAEASPSNVLSVFEFGVDGTLTLPFDNKITVGGDMDSNSINFVLQDSLDPETTFEFAFDASMGMPLLRFPDDSLQSTAWTGGRVVTAPTASTGAEGDKQGDLAFTSSHLYYCIADYNQVGHQVTGVDYLGRASLNTNAFQLTKTADTLQITVGDIISDSDGGATSTVVTVSSDDNYTYVGTGGFAYAGVFPLTFTSTDYVAGGNIWKRIAWSGDTW